MHMSSAKQGVKRALALGTGVVLSAGALTMVAPAAIADVNIDEISSSAVIGPVRNGGTEGAKIVVKTKAVNTGNLAVEALPADNTQAVLISQSAVVPDDATNPNGGLDGFDEITLYVALRTPQAGDTAKFTIYNDENGNNNIGPAEARQTFTKVTAGPVKNVQITPSSQSAPVGVNSGNYTISATDDQNRPTQLTGTEEFGLTSAPAGVAFFGAGDDDAPLAGFEVNALELRDGTAAFQARGPVVNTTYVLTATGANNGGAGNVLNNTVTTSATLITFAQAALTRDEVNVVTGADSCATFNSCAISPGAATVRSDQAAIKFDIQGSDVAAPFGVADDANTTVAVTVASAPGNLTFGGAASQTITTVLDSDGRGSFTVNVDPASILDGRSFTVNGSGFNNFVVTYGPSAATQVTPTATTYISKFGGTVNVEATVTDAFGAPVSGAWVSVRRNGGVNADATESPRKQTGADGTVTFALTDTKATAVANNSDNVLFSVYATSTSVGALATDNTARILYNADGLGGDFNFTVDGLAINAASYNPANVLVEPLIDGVVGGTFGTAASETLDIVISGGTPGAPATVSVDGGSLLLTPAQTLLSQGRASRTTAFSNPGGTLNLRVIGTTDGLKTITVVSGGRTKTAQFTVKSRANDGLRSGRNIAITGDTTAEPGAIVTFIAKVTDAFGNPAVGFGNTGNTSINVQVTGDARLQDTDALTDSNGEYRVRVKLDDDADGDITVKVTGFNAQFGAGANQLFAGDTTNTAPGLTASVLSATATVAVDDIQGNLDELEAAVEAAQAAFSAALAELQGAQGQVNVAKAQLKANQADKAGARAALRQAQKALKKARNNGGNVGKAQARVARSKRQLAKEVRQVTVSKVRLRNAKALKKDAFAAKEQARIAYEAAVQALEDAQP